MTESKEYIHPGMCPDGGVRDGIAASVSDEMAAGDHSVTEDAYESDTEILQLLRIIREETKDSQRSDAFSALQIRYRPLTEHMVSKYARAVYGGEIPSADRQELEEEACIALYHAARFYRAGTHATFGYFARVCIRNRLVSFLRKQRHEVHHLRIEQGTADTDSPPQPLHSVALTVGDVGEQIAEQDAFRALFDRFLTSLTDYERRVFHRYVKGCTYKEIARALDVPLKSVDNAVYRIRVKLKQQLQESI